MSGPETCVKRTYVSISCSCTRIDETGVGCSASGVGWLLSDFPGIGIISTMSVHDPCIYKWGWSLPNILAASSCDRACTMRLVLPSGAPPVDDRFLVLAHPFHPAIHPLLLLLGRRVFHHLLKVGAGSHVQTINFFMPRPPS